MARLNITLDQDKMLALLSKNSGDAFRTLLEKALNQILLVESEAQLKAAPYERTEALSLPCTLQESLTYFT